MKRNVWEGRSGVKVEVGLGGAGVHRTEINRVDSSILSWTHYTDFTRGPPTWMLRPRQSSKIPTTVYIIHLKYECIWAQSASSWLMCVLMRVIMKPNNNNDDMNISNDRPALHCDTKYHPDHTRPDQSYNSILSLQLAAGWSEHIIVSVIDNL